MTKKNALKKYDMSRKNIADTLGEIYDRLSEIDTTDQSPNDVDAELSEALTEIDNLRSRVLDEA